MRADDICHNGLESQNLKLADASYPESSMWADWPTEQINPRTSTIDEVSIAQTLALINAEDAIVAKAVANAIPAIAGVVERVVAGFQAGGRLIYTGAGTSGRLAVLDASECPPTFGTNSTLVQALIAGGDVALRQAVEGAEDDAQQGQADLNTLDIKPQDVVIGVSASGSARYVTATLNAARRAGAFTAAITCVPKSPMALAAHVAMITPVGPEVIAGSTRLKAGTAQKLVLNMISTAAMIHWGKTLGNIMVDVQPLNAKLRQRAKRIVSGLAAVSMEEAQALLQQSGWAVKPAVVMGALGCSLEEAQARLHQAAGKLKVALK
ncbi:MAG: N-acetylmuramic acid 6-phosphate etherase [Vampirovibrionales bacterium]|nr:N-acetylmuramic acid 6-phosphate etherase [Vampirovibrionales bacterium]